MLKQLDQFHNKKAGLFGRNSHCRSCRHDEYLVGGGYTPERKARQAVLRATPETKARLAAYSRAYLDRPEKREARRIYARSPKVVAWHKAHNLTPERQAQQRAYQATARARAIAKAWRDSERGKAIHCSTSASRRARIRGTSSGDRIDWREVYARDKGRCQLCGSKTPRRLRGTTEPRAPEVDHVQPLALGGAHVLANVQLACRRCNARKNKKPLGQLRMAING
jgi:5-methylcytosine-specific restriction endonuclease McrA